MLIHAFYSCSFVAQPRLSTNRKHNTPQTKPPSPILKETLATHQDPPLQRATSVGSGDDERVKIDKSHQTPLDREEPDLPEDDSQRLGDVERDGGLDGQTSASTKDSDTGGPGPDPKVNSWKLYTQNPDYYIDMDNEF